MLCCTVGLTENELAFKEGFEGRQNSDTTNTRTAHEISSDRPLINLNGRETFSATSIVQLIREKINEG